MRKATDEVVEERVLIIVEAIIEGGNTYEIVKHYSSEWKLSERMIYKYISKANDEFKKFAKTEAQTEIGKAINRMNKLFNSSLQIMDYKTCLAIQKEINTMLGLNEAAKMDITTQGEKITSTIDYSKLDTKTIKSIRDATT